MFDLTCSNTLCFQNDIHGLDCWTLLPIQLAVGLSLRQTCQETEEVSAEESGQRERPGGQRSNQRTRQHQHRQKRRRQGQGEHDLSVCSTVQVNDTIYHSLTNCATPILDQMWLWYSVDALWSSSCLPLILLWQNCQFLSVHFKGQRSWQELTGNSNISSM